MSAQIEEKLCKIPILKNVIAFLKKITFSEGSFSLYDIIELYVVGIVKGAVTYRASAISYSFF